MRKEKQRIVDQELRREAEDPTSWIDRYVASRLAFKREITKKTYIVILRQFLTWLELQPGHEPPFDPSGDLTPTAVQTYVFDELAGTGIKPS